VHIQIFDTPDQVTAALARRVADAMSERPGIVLGLPAGRTPVDAYVSLRRMHAEGRADFSRASTFNLDEFAGVPPSDRRSFRHFMDTHLLQGVNLHPDRVHFLNGAASDLDEECRRYEREIEAVGGIDLQILGIGANGHVGFNEPGEALVSTTHRVTLADSTRRDNASLFDDDPSRVPHEGVSMGVGTILKASALVLVATGEAKAACIAKAVNGPVTTWLPASFLQLHRRAEIYVDRGAASMLGPA
jgi:glucosamine-6-phosphate deaminase